MIFFKLRFIVAESSYDIKQISRRLYVIKSRESCFILARKALK